MTAPPLPTISGAPRLAVSLPSYVSDTPDDRQRLLQVALLAERLGVDRVTVPEHVVLGERLDEYARPEVGGRRGGRQPTGPDGSFLDPIVLLSVIAATTSRIRLGTAILIAALRRPIVLAKQAATLDVLSSGRVDLGVGVGWQREEYEAAGLDFATRGQLLDECLQVCRLLWTQPRASHTSERLHFEDIHQMPKPIQSGGVPVWVSGTVNPPVIRRLAAHGSGWLPWGDAADDLVHAIPAVRAGLSAVGRDPAGLMINADLRLSAPYGTAEIRAAIAPVPALMSAGVTDFRIPAPADPVVAEDLLGALVPAFRTIVGDSNELDGPSIS